MAERNDGGPAFPLPDGDWAMNGGMSLRDWFAGQALDDTDWRVTPENIAKRAYAVADAMIAARAETK